MEFGTVTETTDYRALCAELAGWIERSTRHYIQDPDVLIRAYAALAQPENEGPSGDEIYKLALEGDFLVDVGDGFTCMVQDEVEFARAVLARWGNQPAPPAEGADCPACEGVPKPGNQPCAVCGRSALSAEGEVGELVAWLREQADNERGCEFDECEGAVFDAADKLTRAADLIEQRHPAPPAKGDCPACEGVPKPGNQPCAVCGRPAPVPAEGEVAELVARLRYAKHNGGCIPSGVHWGLPDGTTHHGSIYVGDDHAADCARAADLLEQRHPAPVPVAEGEVGELVTLLRQVSDGANACDDEGTAWITARAANLLEQRQAAPVPMSERLPGPEDCDAEGKVWGTAELGGWTRVHHSKISRWRAWLPATALPLPQGEVE